jgi:hypothetical protein
MTVLSNKETCNEFAQYTRSKTAPAGDGRSPTPKMLRDRLRKYSEIEDRTDVNEDPSRSAREVCVRTDRNVTVRRPSRCVYSALSAIITAACIMRSGDQLTPLARRRLKCMKATEIGGYRRASTVTNIPTKPKTFSHTKPCRPHSLSFAVSQLPYRHGRIINTSWRSEKKSGIHL